jgi:hypothetical protein
MTKGEAEYLAAVVPHVKSTAQNDRRLIKTQNRHTTKGFSSGKINMIIQFFLNELIVRDFLISTGIEFQTTGA